MGVMDHGATSSNRGVVSNDGKSIVYKVKRHLKPRRFALRYSPPTLVLEYQIPGVEKLRHKYIKLPDLHNGTDCSEIVQELVAQYPNHLNPKQVSEAQLQRLVQRLIERQSDVHDMSVSHESIVENMDLNAVSQEELDAHKAKMDKLFQANKVDRTDPNFVYDKQVDFQPTESNDWDDDDDESDFGDDDDHLESCY